MIFNKPAYDLLRELTFRPGYPGCGGAVIPGRTPEWNAQRTAKVQAIVDAHCEAHTGVVPDDPSALRTWLLELVHRAYQEGRTQVLREQSRR